MANRGLTPQMKKVVLGGFTRPVSNVPGVALGAYAGAANTYNTYVEIVSDTVVTHDVCAIDVIMGGHYTANAERYSMLDIGVDTAGGTTYVSRIADLPCGQDPGWSSATMASTLRTWHFPLHLPAGTAIAAKWAADAAVSTVGNVMIRLYMGPKHPHLMRTGNAVKAFGSTFSTSCKGTAVTGGNAGVEGTWTEIGTLDAEYFHFTPSFTIQDASVQSGQAYWDIALGDVSNKRIIAHNLHMVSSSFEYAFMYHLPYPIYARGANGDKLYARWTHTAATADPGYCVIHATR